MSYNMCDDIDYFIFKIGFKHLMEGRFKCINDLEEDNVKDSWLENGLYIFMLWQQTKQQLQPL